MKISVYLYWFQFKRCKTTITNLRPLKEKFHPKTHDTRKKVKAPPQKQVKQKKGN